MGFCFYYIPYVTLIMTNINLFFFVYLNSCVRKAALNLLPPRSPLPIFDDFENQRRPGGADSRVAVGCV